MKRYISIIFFLLLTLQLAVTSAGQTIPANGGSLNSGTYALSGNTTINNTLTIASGKNVTVNLNGYTLTANGCQVFNVLSGGTLTIKDERTSQIGTSNKGIITGGKAEMGGCAYVAGTLNLQGGIIENCYATSALKPGEELEGLEEFRNITLMDVYKGYFTLSQTEGCGGAVFVASGGTFSMTGGTIKDCKSRVYGGGVYVNSGANFTMSGENSAIQNNRTGLGGCGVYVGGDFTMQGGTISGNKPNVIGNWTTPAEDSYVQVIENLEFPLGGGVITFGADALFTLEGGSLSGNIASSGGGVLVYAGSGFKMNGANAKLEGNYAVGAGGYGNGGAAYVEAGSIVLNQGTIQKNKALRYGGAVNTNTGGTLEISGSLNVNNNMAGYGGAFSQETGTCNMTLEGAVIVDGNKAKDNGGGVYLQAGSLTLKAKSGNSPQILNNAAENKGGGIYLGSGIITNDSGEYSANKAKTGGAIFIGKGDSGTGILTIKNGELSSNQATFDYGGGIYVEEGTILINGEVGIDENSASKSGGGVYLGSGTFTVEANGNLTVESNRAVSNDGGGIYVGSGDFVIADKGKVNVNANSANAGSGKGGGVYCAGEFSVVGDITMDGNSAYNGGGVCVENGSVELPSEGCYIQNNTAGHFGGGLYVTGDKNAKFHGGVFSGNSAVAGGAVCADGSIELDLAATMEGNEANVGGGMYLANGVKMTFGKGLIRANVAKASSTASTTAKGKNSTSVSGAGGGVFMADNTTLTFADLDALGIYNNSAANAGSDICANGNTTKISLPNVSTMSLEGFDVPGNALYWVEDYFTNESRNNTLSKNIGVRYEDALTKTITSDFDISKYVVEVTGSVREITDYICLDLGYDLVFITLNVTGIVDGDNIKVSMSYTNPSGADVVYRQMLFYGPTTRKIGIPSGEWKFAHDDLTYKYDSPVYTPSQTYNGKYINITRLGLNGATDKNLTINVKFALKPNVPDIEVYQVRKVNRMTL